MATDESVLADWAKFIEEDGRGGPLEPDEMTPEIYAKLIGRTPRCASGMLKLRFERGELTRRKYGLHSFAYRLAKKAG